ncbi:MAG: RluA family pseudouridine synthase [Planctomycetes bacterium]|nr:RluA family pseudouridine synthase [Planctomycetota bacterium]
MADRFVAAAAGPLFEQLARHFADWKRNTLRERLRLGCVTVNGAAVWRHDHALQAGDVVEVLGQAHAAAARQPRPPFAVLLHDDDLLAIDKPAGLLSVSTDDERDRTALALVRAFAGPVWPVHRLDRDTSGVLLFARSREANDRVRGDWDRVEKVYRAVTDGVPDPAQGTIELPLWEDRNLRVHAGQHPEARPASTHYATLAVGRGRSLVELRLDTGRKHQIRVHLAAIGCPVVGDVRYGRGGERLCLHALRLSLPHPRDGRQVVLEAPMPAGFRAFVAAR